MLATSHKAGVRPSCSAPRTRAAAGPRVVTTRAAPASGGPSSSAGACKTCGAAAPEGGCDGEGRMLGGLGAVPGFGWWPIKAYRPCPNLEKAGLEYVRWVSKGQDINSVLFGGGSLAEPQQQTLDRVKETADKGIKIDI